MIDFFLEYKLTDFLSEDVVIEYQSGWNLVGLPAEVEDSEHTLLFPEAIPGTLFSFNEGYISQTELFEGIGYWLQFSESALVQITGSPISSISIEVNEGWNLITGISSNINVNSIQDPDGIIVSATFFEFSSGGYSNTENLEPGRGYWVKANNSGFITIIEN